MMTIIRILIGVALFALICWGYWYTGSRVLLVGLLLAYMPALFALIISAFRDSRTVVVECVKVALWLAVAAVIMFICSLEGWNLNLVLALVLPFLFITAVIIIFEGAAVQAKEEKREKEENIQRIVDAINGLGKDEE